MGYLKHLLSCSLDCDCKTEPCDPCSAPAPTLVCRTASGSQSKCGYGEYVPSTPPKRYLRKTYSGTATGTLYSPAYDEEGNITSECADVSCTSTVQWSGYQEYSQENDCVGGGTDTYAWTHTVNDCPCDTMEETPCYWEGIPSDSATQRIFTDQYGGACVYSGFGLYRRGTGSLIETLSNEYSDSMLWADLTGGVVLSGSYTSEGCTSAEADWDTDHLTLTLRRMGYKFLLPDLTGVACYRITWEENWGGTIVPMSYQWNGSATETPVYTINPGPGEVVVTVGNVVASYDCP